MLNLQINPDKLESSRQGQKEVDAEQVPILGNYDQRIAGPNGSYQQQKISGEDNRMEALQEEYLQNMIYQRDKREKYQIQCDISFKKIEGHSLLDVVNLDS